MTVEQYFNDEETNRRRELVFGVVREPPSPFPAHQAIVTRLASALHQHVVAAGAGTVYVSPLDVVLDQARHLILQPDVLFVAAGNEAIVRNRVWGAPDLVVEVLSVGTWKRDRVTKRRWYGRYGVKEYWLVDPHGHAIEVVTGASDASATFRTDDELRSAVLPGFSSNVGDLFAGR